ncbi:DUF4393 domain-containing protein [Streptococcus parauberis]|uniref:DUF4393 domain-containing protein n=1 Tax=Streptococcus parauberis TaxID=1348 RepID=UPI000C1610E9|nr:DUF4393 domain-containing protein [Streptococcus parauberis]PIA83693.1 hypothetical protein ADO07_01561 [Streptococcus parauberis]
MDFSDINTYWPIASSAFTTFITQGGLKPIFTSLNYMWYSKYGYLTERKAKLKEIENEHIYDIEKSKIENQEKFKNKIDSELSKIPPTSFKKPVEYILAPAINESEQYLSDDILRDMFAKLIASTFDQEREQNLHSAFVQIIKEMTPLDAENLLLINKEGNDHIVQLKWMLTFTDTNTMGSMLKWNNLYIENPNCHGDIMSSSIDNLVRIGLISVDYTRSRSRTNKYDRYFHTPEYQKVYDEMISYNQAGLTTKITGVDLQKGVVEVTDFGKKFISICL